MKSAQFIIWMKSIEQMSRSQQGKLRERLEGETSIDEMITLIEQGMNNEAVCLCCMGTPVVALK